jgi:molecular chaperone DnaK (HSP70)
MRLGIDFGTTHTVVAAVDRGNYPVAGFEWGDAVPSVIAAEIRGGALRFGREAVAVELDPEWVALRSFKRLLQNSGPLSEVRIGPHTYTPPELLAGYFSALRDDLRLRSNLGVKKSERLRAAVSVPAHAPNDQRFMTLDAFQRAGFEVEALLNEPSAAGFEYAHRFRDTLTSRREYVLVYDLGGGTFDASLIHMSGALNEVITSTGIPRLGGDDMDEAILALALGKAGAAMPEGRIRLQLLEECRTQKEAVGPNTRRLIVDLDAIGNGSVTLPIAEVADACAPLVERTIGALDTVMRDPRREEHDTVEWGELAGLYVVGGASAFPVVPRRLREQFGNHRVRRSPHPFAATAIGLATFLDEAKGYELADCLTRHFGVWREAETGRMVTFDPIFLKDTRLPRKGAGAIEIVRRYRSAHNVGHFRFVECGALSANRPDGQVVPWDEIRFPFDPALRERSSLADVRVERVHDNGREVEERYTCSATGLFEVTISVLEEGFSRTYRIGRPSGAGR